jgi:hypothetical protein
MTMKGRKRRVTVALLTKQLKLQHAAQQQQQPQCLCRSYVQHCSARISARQGLAACLMMSTGHTAAA